MLCLLLLSAVAQAVTGTDTGTSADVCWWTGCQKNDWLVQGCEQYNRVQIAVRDCYNGHEFHCCPSTGGYTIQPDTSGDTCWWTGCQKNDWAVRGCAQYNRVQQSLRYCDNGEEYFCCPSWAGGAVSSGAGDSGETCWWTGCQKNDWAVRGCEQYNRVQSNIRNCYNGNEYFCCPNAGADISIQQSTNTGLSGSGGSGTLGGYSGGSGTHSAGYSPSYSNSGSQYSGGSEYSPAPTYTSGSLPSGGYSGGSGASSAGYAPSYSNGGGGSSPSTGASASSSSDSFSSGSGTNNGGYTPTHTNGGGGSYPTGYTPTYSSSSGSSSSDSYSGGSGTNSGAVAPSYFNGGSGISAVGYAPTYSSGSDNPSSSSYSSGSGISHGGPYPSYSNGGGGNSAAGGYAPTGSAGDSSSGSSSGSGSGNCWWTGCQRDDWKVRGCEQYNMIQVNSKYCPTGQYYYCCPKTESTNTQTVIPDSGDSCWWTGCQKNDWAVRGCANYNRVQSDIRYCANGQEYYCCPQTQGANLIPTDSCWWTGCQKNDWKVRGCDNYNRTQVNVRSCDNGQEYYCCTKTAATNPQTVVPDTGGSCWWTGCQKNYWKVRGCDNYNRVQKNVRQCHDGDEFHCCPKQSW